MYKILYWVYTDYCVLNLVVEKKQCESYLVRSFKHGAMN